MTSSTLQLTTLPSGLRVITDTVTSVDSAVVGVWCDVGTRCEDPAENGVAHMVEHMMFKGTPTRSARDINEIVENVGGSMNAYTGHETTAYHMHMLKEDVPLALDLLADMIQRPAMPPEEIERERGVILQEIGMCTDTPDDYVFDLWQETAYPGQMLGAPILGTAEIVSSLSREALLAYVQKFYTPRNLVVSVAGNAQHEDILAQVERLFTDLPGDTSFIKQQGRYHGGEIRKARDLEQSHVVMGFRGVSRHDPDYEAAMALSIILGGGTASRLYHEIREQRGLVYSVYGFHNAYEDTGEVIVYAGTGPEKLPALMPVLCEEIVKMRAPVAAAELSRAKAMIKARLLMAQESMMSRANRQAKHVMHFGKLPDLAEKRHRIEALTVDDLARVAARVFDSKPTLAALGPLDRLESYETIAARL